MRSVIDAAFRRQLLQADLQAIFKGGERVHGGKDNIDVLREDAPDELGVRQHTHQWNHHLRRATPSA